MISNITSLIADPNDTANGGFCLISVDLGQLEGQIPANGPQRQLNKYLSPAEKEKFSSFKLAKRQKEWLGGRIAAKEAASALPRCHDIPLPELEVQQNSQDKPFIQLRPQETINISISHSHELAVAMAGTNSCGIDIEPVSERIQRVQAKFCQDQELAQLNTWQNDQQDNQQLLTMLWCAKEALKKMITPMPGFLELELYHIDKLTVFSFHSKKNHNYQAAVRFIANNYAMAICQENP